MPGERLLDADLQATVECRLETVGRTTGEPRQLRIWFASDGDRLYLLSEKGAAAHWVRNVQAEPRVRVRIEKRWFEGRASVVREAAEDARGRELWAAKYGTNHFERFLAGALPVAVDLEREAG